MKENDGSSGLEKAISSEEVSEGKKSDIQGELYNHVIDSTAIVSMLNPICAVLETTVMGISPEVSINAKYFASTLHYLGLGSLFSRGRDLSYKAFNVDTSVVSKKQKVVDTAYGAVFSFASTFPILTFSGSDDFMTTLKASAISGVVYAPLAIASSYSIDVYRDLMGRKDSIRCPDVFKNKSNLTKKGIVGALTIGSVALTAAYYNAFF